MGSKAAAELVSYGALQLSEVPEARGTATWTSDLWSSPATATSAWSTSELLWNIAIHSHAYALDQVTATVTTDMHLHEIISSRHTALPFQSSLS